MKSSLAPAGLIANEEVSPRFASPALSVATGSDAVLVWASGSVALTVALCCGGGNAGATPLGAYTARSGAGGGWPLSVLRRSFLGIQHLLHGNAPARSLVEDSLGLAPVASELVGPHGIAPSLDVARSEPHAAFESRRPRRVL